MAGGAGPSWLQSAGLVPVFVVFLVAGMIVVSLVGLFPVAGVWCGLVRM